MPRARPKVLILEDQSRSRRLLEEIVAPMGVEPHFASSRGQLLEMAETVRPEVILIDLMVPGVDGMEMYRRLKEERATRNIPVFFIAGGVGLVASSIQDIIVEASLRSAIRMKELSDEADELIRQRTSLTHMIVHDIYNLLAINVGYAGLLLSMEELPAVVRQALLAIEKSSKEIQLITSSLLEMGRLESGLLPISLEKIQVWDLAQERLQLLRSQTMERRIHIAAKFESADGPSVRADRSLLSRVLDNILFNAIKFCPDEGAVEVGFSTGDRRCTIAVTNDGSPIPPEQQERIFEKFAQVEAHHASGRKGLGIGLAFCKMALEAMSGGIAVESPVLGREDGTRFKVSLPLAE